MRPRTALVSLLLVGCRPDVACPRIAPVEPTTGQNLLLVILDDVSADQMALYGNPEGAQYETPNIDCLADQGMTFERAWSFPSCSPSRAAMTTGQYPRRWNIGRWITPEDGVIEVSPDAPSVARVLQDAEGGPYAVAHFGKWHMASFEGPTGLEHPARLGYHHHAGSFANLYQSSLDVGDIDLGYDRWEKVIDGVPKLTRKYPTEDVVRDTLEWIAENDEPWFATVSFNAPHSPLHSAPRRYSRERVDEGEDNSLAMYRTMLTAADDQIGRLVRDIDPDVLARTTIVVVADNGSPKASRVGPNRSNSKATLFEGGVNVPLVVVGPTVVAPGSRTRALVSVTDLLPTFAQLAGAPVPEGLDGVGFAEVLADPALPGPRRWLFAENFRPNGVPVDEQTRWARAVRGERYKLIRKVDDASVTSVVELFFDLEADPLELPGSDLLSAGERHLSSEQREALVEIRAELNRIVDHVSFGGEL